MTLTKPESVLSGRGVNTNLEDRDSRRSPHSRLITKGYTKDEEALTEGGVRRAAAIVSQEFPRNIKPMLTTAVNEPFNDKEWVFEIKWDGLRSIFFLHKTKAIFKMQSRSGKEITHR